MAGWLHLICLQNQLSSIIHNGMFYYHVIREHMFLLKNGTWDFQNSPLFERSACFYVTISVNFERFQYFNFETDFLKKENLFQKTGVPYFS